MSLKKVFLYSLLAAGIFSCTSVQTDTKEKEIYAFFQRFNESLAKPDDEIFKHFETQQSAKAILMVIRILQNKSDQSIECSASFNAPHLSDNPNEIIVSIPINVSVIGIDRAIEQIFLPFHLTKNEQGQYVITRIEGEQLYNTIQRLKSDNEWTRLERDELQNRATIYATARQLEQQYDSVIWYVNYNKQNYFYVVDSTWTNYFLHYKTRNLRNENVKMGLCDSTGTLIIPIQYNLIGTIGFERPNLVEVTRNNKVGYFDLSAGTEIIEPRYDMVVPAADGESWIVKSDETYGWIDNTMAYTEGLPSDSVKAWVDKFNYLHRSVRLENGKQPLCEIPNEQNAGNGIVIPSTYLVRNGLFDYIESGLVSTSVPMNGWTEYKEARSSVLEQISGSIRALISTVTERYLEGREEFYTQNKMVFFNNALDTLSVEGFGGDEISYRLIDSTLLEVISPHDFGFQEMEVAREHNSMSHSYISLADGKPTKLNTNRYFPETQFVKLDSSYLNGKFFVYDHELGETVEKTFLSEYTITWMRNDILAAYGYSFPGTDDSKKYYGEWYVPIYNSREAFEDKLTDIDRHNLTFLEKVLALMKTTPV